MMMGLKWFANGNRFLFCQALSIWTFPKIFRRAEQRMAAEVAAYLLVLRVKV
jgi:hypothetical protein